MCVCVCVYLFGRVYQHSVSLTLFLPHIHIKTHTFTQPHKYLLLSIFRSKETPARFNRPRMSEVDREGQSAGKSWAQQMKWACERRGKAEFVCAVTGTDVWPDANNGPPSTEHLTLNFSALCLDCILHKRVIKYKCPKNTCKCSESTMLKTPSAATEATTHTLCIKQQKGLLSYTKS